MEPVARQEHRLSEAYCTRHPGEAARLLERLSAEEATEALSALDAAAAAAVLGHCAPDSAVAILAALPVAHAGATTAQFDVAVAAQLLRLLAERTREAIIAAVPPQPAQALLRVLRFPEGTAGAMADPFVPAVPNDLSVGEALTHLRSIPRVRLHYYIYVIDRKQQLVGVLDLRDLLCAAPEEPVAMLMQTDVLRVSVWADRAAILAHPGWRQVHTLPVVATGDRYVGVLRHDTLRRLTAASERGGDLGGALALGLTLAEVYWAGMSRLFSSQGGAPGPTMDKRLSEHDSE